MTSTVAVLCVVYHRVMFSNCVKSVKKTFIFKTDLRFVVGTGAGRRGSVIKTMDSRAVNVAAGYSFESLLES